MLGLVLMPGAGSGDADGRQAHASALLIQVPELFQLIQGTGIWFYGLFLPPAVQDLTVEADSGSVCADCSDVGVRGFFVFSCHELSVS